MPPNKQMHVTKTKQQGAKKLRLNQGDDQGAGQ